MTTFIAPDIVHKASQRQVRNAIKIALLVIGVAGSAHVALGSDPIVPAIAILILALSMLPLMRYGVMNITSILIVLIAFRYIGFPLFVKLSLGQPLDTNLEQPVAAYSGVMLGVVGYLGAVILSNRIDTGKPLLKPLTSPYLLRRLSFAAFAVGFVANLITAQNAYTEISTTHYFTPFTSFIHLALITSIVAVLLRTNFRQIMDMWTIIVLLAEVIFAFALNVRTPIMEAFLCVLIILFVYQIKISKRYVIGGVVTIVLLFALTPAILYVRSVRSDVSLYERIRLTVDAIVNLQDAQSALEIAMAAEALSSGYFMNYYGFPSAVLERFSHVNDVDVLISGADSVGKLGFEVLNQAVDRVIPKSILPNKPNGYAEGDWIYCEFGVKCLYGNYLTASLIGVGYAAFGWLGTIAFPFLLGFPVFLFIKKMVGFSMEGNFWVVFMLVVLNNQIVEGGAATYIATLFRQLPLLLVVMLMLFSIARISRSKFRISK